MEETKPVRTACCSRCHASPLSSQEIQDGWLCTTCSTGAAEQMEAQRSAPPQPGVPLATTPCQMMLDGLSPAERPCGAMPTVGGNGLYRYCERHLEMVAKAGATTLQRDDDLVAAPARTPRQHARAQEIDTRGIIVTGSAPGCAECGKPGASAVKTAIGWEGRCGTDGRCWSQPEAGALDLADADDLRKRFGLPEPTAPPETLPDVWSSEAMQRYNERDRERVQQALARHAATESDAPSFRPDGFSQAAVDAAKAVLLAPASKRGGR